MHNLLLIVIFVCVQVWQWPVRSWTSLSRCVWATRRSLEAWGTANNSPPHSHPPVSDHAPCPPLPPNQPRLSHQPPLPRPSLSEAFTSSALAGRRACWNAELEHIGAVLSCPAVCLSGIPLPLLLGEQWVPMNWMTENGQKEGEQGREGRRGRAGADFTLSPQTNILHLSTLPC